MTQAISQVLLLRHAEFPTRTLAFSKIKAFLERFGADASLRPEDWFKLVLLTEELFTNSIHHTRADDSAAMVRVEVASLKKHIRLTYEDTAPPYNPLSEAERVNLQLPAETRPDGLAMLLTVRLTEGARYSYVQGRNRVELILSRSR